MPTDDVLTFAYTPADLRRARTLQQAHTLGSTRARLAAAMPLGVAVVVVVGLADAPWAAALMGACTLLLALGLRRLADRNQVAAFTARAKRRGLAAMYEMRARGDGLHTRTPVQDVVHPWGGVRVSDEAGAVLVTAGPDLLYVPASAFHDDAHRARFVALLRERAAPAAVERAGPAWGRYEAVFTPTLEDVRASALRLFIGASSPSLLLLLLPGSVVVFGAAALLWQGAPAEVSDALGVVLCAACLVPILGELSLRRSFARTPPERIAVRLTDEGVRVRGERETLMPWGQFTGVSRTAAHVYLESGATHVQVPRHAFRTDAAFVAFAEHAAALRTGALARG